MDFLFYRSAVLCCVVLCGGNSWWGENFSVGWLLWGTFALSFLHQRNNLLPDSTEITSGLGSGLV